MPAYSEIVDDWFYLLLPAGRTAESFEEEPAPEDRAKTEDILQKMTDELPRLFAEVLRIPLEYSPRTLARIDRVLHQRAIARWVAESDPEDPNNDFKLTLCELAVFLGNLLVIEHGGSWHFARFPNYFNSTVIVGEVEFHVFDTVMKRCSADHGHETLASKWQIFEALIQAGGEPPAAVH